MPRRQKHSAHRLGFLTENCVPLELRARMICTGGTKSALLPDYFVPHLNTSRHVRKRIPRQTAPKRRPILRGKVVRVAGTVNADLDPAPGVTEILDSVTQGDCFDEFVQDRSHPRH